MKMHILAAAVALMTGAALAQTPAEKTPVAPGVTPNAAGSTSSATGSSAETKDMTHPATITEKSSSDTKASASSQKKASASSHKKASAKNKNTQSMGAGAVTPETDLGASARSARIESAYANWQARR
jgi:hypothetical protein